VRAEGVRPVCGRGLRKSIGVPIVGGGGVMGLAKTGYACLVELGPFAVGLGEDARG
jgi:hypothetical protein